MPAAISPTAASRCLQPRIALEFLDVGDILKREQQARIAARCLKRRGREPELDLPAVARAVGRLDAAAPRRIGKMRQLVGHVRRQLQHLFEAPADHRERGMAGNRLGGAIERQDPALTVGRRQTARQTVDDVLVERLQVGNLARRALESGARALQSIGERAAEKRDREKQEDVQAGGVRHDARRRQRAFTVEERDAEQAGQPEILRHARCRDTAAR